MTSETWVPGATAIAVIVSILLQKWDARHVRRRLESSAKARDEKLDAIHSLVNGRMGAELRIALLQARRIAELTSDPRDIALAKEAERIYEEHQERMLRVDIAASKQVDKGE